MDLCHQWAGCIDNSEPERICLGSHSRSYAVGGKDNDRAGRNFREIVCEHGAELAQFAHHVFVVNYLMAHVYRGAVLFERSFDDLDCAVDTGAEPARAC